jgi:hypothetical protein
MNPEVMARTGALSESTVPVQQNGQRCPFDPSHQAAGKLCADSTGVGLKFGPGCRTAQSISFPSTSTKR